MNARVQEIESDAGDVEPLRPGAKRENDLRLVEDREWTEAFLAGERRILEMIAKGDSLVPILDAMCRLVEEMSSGSLATILLLDEEGKRLRHAAAPSLPASYTEAMGDIPVGASVGSCGTAAYRREPVFVADIATDPLWTDYRDLPLAHGLRASWSTPIFSSAGCVLGTFAILSREPRSPAPLHHHIIEQITHLAAVAIEREHTESALRQSEERFRRMADAIPEVIWFTALEPEKVLYVSPSFERIWGLPVKDLYQNPRLWIEAIHPEDRDRVTRAYSIWVAGGQVSSQALANQAMLAIQLTRLSAQSRQSAVVAERNRMARDIHDTLAQGFTSVILQLEAVGEATSQRLAGKAGEHLTRASELAREGLREARRSVWALRPQTLEEKDLCEALKELIQKMTEGTSVQAHFTVQGEPRELPPEWEENLLRIGQEVLTNVLRHAQATKFNAQLAFDKGEVRLNLRDNGSGFDPIRRHDGFGLQGMRERVEGMGGQLSIQSAEGEGTTISIALPLANAFHLAA